MQRETVVCHCIGLVRDNDNLNERGETGDGEKWNI